MSFISEKYNCLFIHIPKTGGTSIEKLLIPEKIKESKRFKNKYKIQTFGHRNKHKPFIFFVETSNLFKFSFVRNPYHRLSSLYSYDLQIKKHDTVGLDYNEWLEKRVLLEDFNSIDFHRSPMYYFLENKKGKIDFNFIGRFENFTDHMNIIMKKFNIKQDLPHININPGKREIYLPNNKNLKKFNKMFHKDFILFNYDKI